ncbi:crossover junction endodeoxyribonuclease RuvC [Candidatus Roizmanbacteria bacterium RIFCSPHIGHO2_02_FULL_40_13b]|uniref:Crossover junction endodeoxyribonuclease RuvC n=1 Tax=Candidatus Roizmanbacteria bacterium RIFCSPHIGHO2_01_FULL_39_24 TaxID=1802032 RepID=A0A1F7GHM7_9BACT|nr:MAG: crossover junction endodeoxyribonuclease RuvC [Candidatus Roizmanbacteria bacterium RIFCSPHIGHO2_01_FULL_39_24]OGK26751.1 MAG: crossover junction endodeoxyribonuclease RuvC [Candidatus Roizmanbacteria bacterium RIFCSPHIGHO2_02_FULL_40_13b]OGK48978.1 MAG: crossover junction endodeoxyribonuclease RuvC [Candidatus Roizmanbacteria bacterium RIFCSPLOWO2_01_FULL_40_32]OGK57499.1 MAG: crossover junction endodeoxyribonuclease RuvC [Candidatus Roizmanbacteria bacterium RIFCSPLOWO2_02_FULL_39_8]
MRVLALDSGIERTGYAVFDYKNKKHELLAYGLVKTSKNDDLSARLFELSQKLDEILMRNTPDVCVLEQLFFNTNQKTAIIVAQAQGATILTVTKRSIPVEFISPLTVKQAITGDGRADKKQIQKMVSFTIKFPVKPETDDVYDAVACGMAYCILHK